MDVLNFIKNLVVVPEEEAEEVKPVEVPSVTPNASVIKPITIAEPAVAEEVKLNDELLQNLINGLEESRSGKIGYFVVKNAISQDSMQSIPSVRDRIDLAISNFKMVDKNLTFESVIDDIDGIINEVETTKVDALTAMEDLFKKMVEPMEVELKEVSDKIEEAKRVLQENEEREKELKSNIEAEVNEHENLKKSTEYTYQYLKNIFETDKNIMLK